MYIGKRAALEGKSEQSSRRAAYTGFSVKKREGVETDRNILATKTKAFCNGVASMVPGPQYREYSVNTRGKGHVCVTMPLTLSGVGIRLRFHFAFRSFTVWIGCVVGFRVGIRLILGTPPLKYAKSELLKNPTAF